MKEYFNLIEFKRIIHTYNKDVLATERMFRDYFESYPMDYSAYPYFVNLLITLGKFDEAEEVLNDVEKRALQNSRYYSNEKKFINFRYRIIKCHLKLLVFQKRYQDALNYCANISSDPVFKIFGDNIKTIVMYCRGQLGFLRKDFRATSGYLYSQIIEYREEDFLEHVRKHLMLSDEEIQEQDLEVKMFLDDDLSLKEEKEECTSLFVPDFPIREVIEEIKRIIPCGIKLNHGFFDNTYCFRYDGCGRLKNKLVNYFKIVAFDGTAHFITMFPCEEGEFLPHFDLNHLRPREEVKVKKISRIERFNRRYGM